MNTQDQKEFIKGTPAHFSATIGKFPLISLAPNFDLNQIVEKNREYKEKFRCRVWTLC